jgi:hypothetical protein
MPGVDMRGCVLRTRIAAGRQRARARAKESGRVKREREVAALINLWVDGHFALIFFVLVPYYSGFIL